jgi:hypothetical protein
VKNGISAHDDGVAFSFPDAAACITCRGREPSFRLFLASASGVPITPAAFAPPVVTADDTGLCLVYRGADVAGAGPIVLNVRWAADWREILGCMEI